MEKKIKTKKQRIKKHLKDVTMALISFIIMSASGSGLAQDGSKAASSASEIVSSEANRKASKKVVSSVLAGVQSKPAMEL